MRFVEMVGARKQGATEPPFFGAIKEQDGSPTDLTGILDMRFRLGTPGTNPLLDEPVTVTDETNGVWEFRPTKMQAEALPLGEVLVHLVINWDADIVEFVPYDHYLKLEILKPL